MTNQVVFYNNSASAWEKAPYAFLARGGWPALGPRV